MTDARHARFRTVEQRVLDRHLGGVQEHRLSWAGSSIRVIEVGSGPTIVFLHGVTGTLTNFASLAAGLKSENRCLLVDLPGHGLSGPLELKDRTPRAALTDAVCHVLTALAPSSPAVLVGNSLGGMTALYVAADHPSLVASIAIVGEPAYAFTGARARFPLDTIGRPLIGRLLLAAPPPPMAMYRRTIRRGFGDKALDRIDEDVLDANRLAVWAGRNAASVSQLMQALMGRRGRAAPGVALGAPDIARIGMPVWFLWGTDDPFMSPKTGRPWVDRFPNATLDVVEGGHVPWFDAPDLATTRIADLRSNS